MLASRINPTAGRSGRPSVSKTSSVLRALWVALIIAGELGVFYWSLIGCQWPSVEIPQKMRDKVKPTHVLMIADPQIHHSAFLAGGSWWAHPVRRVLFELNMRKNWHVTSRLQPDAVIFLGDMLANGKAARTLGEYTQATQKFKAIFECDDDVPMYYIPGNNDVGLGAASTTKNSYFAANFGPLNQKFQIANHDFVGLDAAGLVYEDYQQHAKHLDFDTWTPTENSTISFVKDVAQGLSGRVILLSHIPLARPESADCGPLREKGTIRKLVGHGYQSMLGKETTSFLLRQLKPMVVYSADNRDYCDYIHVLPGTRDDSSNPENFVREVTVKSFSMSVHIRQPGFQLVTLVDPAKVATPASPSYADAACFLPDQSSIYTIFYLPCFVITLLVLFVLNRRKESSRTLKKQRSLDSPTSSGRSTPLPLVNGEAAPWSAAWSPFSPAMPTSPRSSLPSHLRTPRLASNSATHLVASFPGTPAPSSPASYLSPIPHEDDEEDTMFPAQYAIRRESDEWSHIGMGHTRDEDFEVVFDQESAVGTPSSSISRSQSKFISAPSRPKVSAPPRRSRWSWSYSFVIRGRRRRLTLGLPSSAALGNLLDLVGVGSMRSARLNRGGSAGMIIDVVSVFWPATVAWIVINWSAL
ncbi:hypothetical protein D9619_001903 [Psilocybe cf. subviscida]|uniref:Calcineurin-like phosphoesterase domain-containing protein n=1 Tax=Psilocybe cf. subviscida TaxID=2480587 RepID=A0A8H5BFR2_9AGAR|nr:hypothetical protein D9619_001903 [Psilocybe cf. subviscida]